MRDTKYAHNHTIFTPSFMYPSMYIILQISCINTVISLKCVYYLINSYITADKNDNHKDANNPNMLPQAFCVGHMIIVDAAFY